MEFNNKITCDNAMKFMKSFSSKHNGISNVYVFTSVDKNGKVVDEKYSMNFMTYQGFSEIYANGVSFGARDTSGNTVRLYVGTGVGETPYTPNDTDLELPAFGGLAATNQNTEKDFAYPMYYSKGENDGEGFITLISRFVVAYYDYNISNFPGEYNLTEYGIKHNDTLWTHSKIYDMQGEPAAITKSPNERLYITVYMCLSMYESIIMNGWENNRFAMITRNDIMFDRMGWETRVNIYKRGNRTIDITNGGTTRTQDILQTNTYTNSTVAPRIILNDNNSDTYNSSTNIFGGGYIDGYMLSENGFICIEPQFLDVAEDINIVNYQSNDPTTYTGFSDKFGANPNSGYSKNQYPQMTHFFDASAYLFDVVSGDWTCALDVYNPDDKLYDETPMDTKCCLPIYYYSNSQITTGYVYQNIHPDDKIIQILSGGSTIYATNKYWASSNSQNNDDPDKGWVWIRDYNNIPLACQSARYWITNTNTDSIAFKRESDTFQLLEKDTESNGYSQYLEYNQKTYIAPISDNYQYGWYKRGNTVYIPDLPGRPTYTVGSDSDETMTFGKWMIVFPSSNNEILCVDMSNTATGEIIPQTVELPFTGLVNSLTQTHRTETGTGLICIESTNTDECVVIDIRNEELSISVHSWKHACCMWGVNKIAYVDVGDLELNVFNYDTNHTEGDPIVFPEEITDVPHIFGHTNYLWMTDGSTFGYVCDITSSPRTLQGFTYAGLYGSGLSTVKYTCVDEAFIVYKYDENGSDSIKHAHYIKLTDPTIPHDMDDFSTRTSAYSIGGRIIFDLRYANRYSISSTSSESRALALTIMRGWNNVSPGGCECRIFDFGQYLNNGEVHYSETSSDTNFGNLCLYGENVIYRYTKKIPIINYLPIKLVGKTDTINSMEYIKSITGKSWLISYTNTPSWGESSGNIRGIPPGIPLATTDNTGTITGWR